MVSLKIEGKIGFTDDRDFNNALKDINQHNYRVQFDSVVLDSPGGIIYNAIEIGTAIRGNHLSTLVMASQSCTSSCALILQGGVCEKKLLVMNYPDPSIASRTSGTVCNKFGRIFHGI